MSEQETETSVNQDSEAITLSDEQCLVLLRIARQAIEQTVNNYPVPREEEMNLQLQQNAAVFVTLWQGQALSSEAEKSKHLRGCIGRLQPDFPLHLAVKNAAISAATRDPRFNPVQAAELESISIEIAILTPLEVVDSLEEIVLGRDGMVIEANGRRGLLLPKVASRLNWDRIEYLQNLCLKAGLPDDTWPDSGQLFRFQTIELQE